MRIPGMVTAIEGEYGVSEGKVESERDEEGYGQSLYALVSMMSAGVKEGQSQDKRAFTLTTPEEAAIGFLLSFP